MPLLVENQAALRCFRQRRAILYFKSLKRSRRNGANTCAPRRAVHNHTTKTETERERFLVGSRAPWASNPP
eukprot:659898-Pyramimonas_sp.AAC.1